MTRLGRFLTRRDILWQILFLAGLVAVVWLLVETATANLARLSVKSGYGFLWEPARFELGESLIPYAAGDSYFRAFLVGLLNTLKVAALGILLSILLGLLLALGQLSTSVVVSRAARFYIETVRNVPLLLQLIFWHTFITRALPPVRRALSPIDGIFLSNRGLYLPSLAPDPAHGQMAWALLAGLACGFALFRLSECRRRRTGSGFAWLVPALGFVLGLPLLVFALHGAPLALDLPRITGFNFKGGLVVSPEFAAVLLGLTLYTASFNAEIFRAGILGVPRGQAEAGTALGLTRWQVMRLVTIPQALRIVVPPLTNSCLNLTKESSLSVAIGYPELVRVANITLAETSQSIECVSIIMVVYLFLSLITAAIAGWVNRSVALVRQ